MLNPSSSLRRRLIFLKDTRPPFQPFTLFLRGLEQTGHKTVNKNTNKFYDMSRLSKGVKCAMQGREYFRFEKNKYYFMSENNFFNHFNVFFFFILVTIFPIFSSNGIFIWWPKVEYVNVTEYLIQFWHNDSSNPFQHFSNEIIGTTIEIQLMQEWNDIERDLIKFPATINIYSRASPLNEQMITQRKRRQLFGGDEDDGDDELDGESDLDYSDDLDMNIRHIHSKSRESDKTVDDKDFNKNEVITEVRVNGNVTGILIPNIHRIVVRVIVKDREGELGQDIRYVQWNTVSALFKKKKCYEENV